MISIGSRSMAESVQHVLGISGGKDSATLALCMNRYYSDLDTNYYTCDTGKELKETYELIKKPNKVLKREISLFKSEEVIGDPFDYFLEKQKVFLPSANADGVLRN